MLAIYHEQLIFTMRTPREGSQGLTLLSARVETSIVETSAIDASTLMRISYSKELAYV